MANKAKGEIGLTVGDKEYTLFLGTNAMALLEAHFSTPDNEVGFQEIHARLLAGDSLIHVRAYVWAALQKYHPGITLAGAGELIDEVGGVFVLNTKLAEAAGIALPTEADLQAAGADAVRPQSAREMGRRRAKSTGKVSSRTLAASV